MSRSCLLAFLLALAGCSAAPPPARVHGPSPCVPEEASYACQVERYNNVNAP